MYLADLELQGFKSFANKTKVVFDSGITAIVGPNGCGKSNIVDSLRWVLGEQKPTALRSASMTNVIFNGTSKKKALGLAEVSVTIHNNKGVLPIEFNDVTITRRLFRSGESEYLLNGTPCRLRDIVDLFMDTGMGSGAYSVIELKMVEEILNDKANNRRQLFEEAAGVMKYKERRKQAFKKLKETRDDLQRLEDVLVVIRKNIRSLEIQAQKARRSKKLSTELEFLELGLAKHETDRIQLELQPLQKKRIEAELQKEEFIQLEERIETTLKLSKESLSIKDDELKKIQAEFGLLIESIRSKEQAVELANQRINHEELNIKQFEQEIYLSEKDIQELKTQIEIHRKDAELLDAPLQNIKQNLIEAKSKFENFNLQFEETNTQLKTLKTEHQNLQKAVSKKQTDLIRLESNTENFQNSIQQIESQIESVQAQLNELKNQNTSSDDVIEEARNKIDVLELELDDARSKRDRYQNEINVTKDQIRSLDSQLDKWYSEIQLLQDIARSNETFPNSVQFLQKQDSSTFKVVSELFKTEEALAIAVEAALGQALYFIVVPNIEDAHRGIQLLKNHNKGIVSFIPLDLLTIDTDREGSLSEQVECEQKYQALKQFLLNDCKLIDSLSNEDSNFRLNITPDGEMIEKGKIIRAGSRQKNLGIRVGLKDKIQKLEKLAIQKEEDLDRKKSLLREAEYELSQIKITEIQENLKTANQDIRHLESKMSSYLAQNSILEKNLSSYISRKSTIQEQYQSNQDSIQQIKPELNQIREQLKKVTEKEFVLSSELDRISEKRNRSKDLYNDAQLEYQALKNKQDGFLRELERDTQQIDSIKNRLNQKADQAKRSKDIILESRDLIYQYQDELEVLTKNRDELKITLDEVELVNSKERGKINLLLDEQRTMQKKKEVQTEIAHQLDLKKAQMDMELKQISDHIWETYSMIIDDIEHGIPEDTDVDVVKQTITAHRQKIKNIGEINALAIEEFEEEKKKLDFYEEQIADLIGAEEKLNQTIHEINETAQAHFMETFNAIRENFIDVFKTLFEETDSCDLILEENEEDPLESKIEIFAQPKGKRPSHINQLSGGEKTLTAIALLFAIYLVKPSPFCILDEVDAPLDDANIERFAKIIRRFSDETQFIIITHNKKTMEKAERMYGVTMQETGVSSLVGVQMDQMN